MANRKEPQAEGTYFDDKSRWPCYRSPRQLEEMGLEAQETAVAPERQPAKKRYVPTGGQRLRAIKLGAGKYHK